ncbi:hypothetical protein FKO01_38860 [Mesorhizobium sp. B2-3-3]|nr:hypothetical protein FKO01_38860 [Mesorhizobium sp. B2-3-3]
MDIAAFPVGIPIYSADPEVHDYVVQSKGAFNKTIRGIVNLKAVGAEVEIRVVVHKQTYEGLADLSDFIFQKSNLRRSPDVYGV